MFETIELEGTIILRAMKYGHNKIIVTTKACLIVVTYLLSAKQPAVNSASRV